MKKGWIIASGITVILLVAGSLLLGPLFLTAKTASLIKIPKNATKEIVRDQLNSTFGPWYASGIIRAAGFLGTDFSTRHGAYMIEEGTAAWQAARTLLRGAQTPIKLTLTGARTPEDLAEQIASKLDFKAQDLLKAMADKGILDRYGLTEAQAPALFLNDTYEVWWSSTPEELIAKMGSNYNRVWNPERLAKAEALGLTPAEVTTIASIVDEETNAKSEKGKVGRLYINRLQKGMPLQADPTVRYAVGDFSLRRITGAHLKTQSPYNTYLHNGLPPGPIRTVGTDTIDAVLNSKPSGDLFMCAKEDFSGTHNFASTYAEHRRNAARYQAALNSRGIR